MPLHDWSDPEGWEGVHLFWLTELARHVKERLPAGYRAYLKTVLTLAVGAPPPKPDDERQDAKAAKEEAPRAEEEMSHGFHG